MAKYECDADTALRYYALRDEGVPYEQALVWCGLRDPAY